MSPQANGEEEQDRAFWLLCSLWGFSALFLVLLVGLLLEPALPAYLALAMMAVSLGRVAWLILVPIEGNQ